MPSFEVPVEEIISRRVVHTVKARDAAHASALVRSMLTDGRSYDGPIREKTLQTVVCAPDFAKKADGLPSADGPVETIAGLSNSQLKSMPGPIVVGELVIHTKSPLVYWRGMHVRLGANQYRLILELALHVDRAVARYDLLEAMNPDNEDYDDRTCDSNIKVLRRILRKLDADFNPFTAVCRLGYRLNSVDCGAPAKVRDLSDARLYVDTMSRVAFLDGKLLVLAPGTFELLAAMARHPDMVFDDDTIVRYGCPLTGSVSQSPSSSRTAIKRIRNAAEEACGDRDIILTHHGLGVSLHPYIGKPVVNDEFA